MKILVTGGAGFIGSHLAEALIAKGHDVIIIDNFSTGSKANLDALVEHPKFQLIEGDILEPEILEEAFSGVELVYHLAAAVGVKYVIDNPLKSIHTNVLGAENVLRFAHHYKCRLVLASTSEVYGKNEAVSLREDSDRILGATNITRWSYASSKALDEYMAFAYHHHHRLPIVVARLFNTCGPRQSGRYGMVIPRFIEQAIQNKPITVYGSGKQVRAFTFVNDTVEALILLGFSETCTGEIFNVGSEKGICSIAELAQEVKIATDSRSEIIFVSYEEAYERGFEDMGRRVPDIRKLKAFVGFEARVPLREILQRTIPSVKHRYQLQGI